MKLKICGIRTQEMFYSCVKFSVDFLGFNFTPSSKRKINPAKALKFFENKNLNQIQTVAIFQNQNLDEIKNILKIFPAKILQFHGNEDINFLQEIKKKFPQKKIWKAFSIDQNFDFKILKKIDLCDSFLFDGKNPGSGQRILVDDLKKVTDFAGGMKKNFGVAGGVCTENIDFFKNNFPKTEFLDIASGVEKNQKFDFKLLEKIVYLMRKK